MRGVAKLLTNHSFIMAAERSPRVALGTRWPCVPSLSEEGLVLRTHWLPAGQLWGLKGAGLGSQRPRGGAWSFPWKCQGVGSSSLAHQVWNPGRKTGIKMEADKSKVGRPLRTQVSAQCVLLQRAPTTSLL